MSIRLSSPSAKKPRERLFGDLRQYRNLQAIGRYGSSNVGVGPASPSGVK